MFAAVIEFNEQEESLKTAGYIAAYWEDQYLSWNSSDYNGVDILFVVGYFRVPRPGTTYILST
jgi:hypothetical protein